MNFDRTCCVCKRKRPISRGCRNDYSRYGGRKGSGKFICAACAAETITTPKTLRIVPDKDGMVRVLPEVKS